MGWRMVRWELELGFLREKRYGRRNGQLNVGPPYGGDATLPLFEWRWGVFLVATKKEVIGRLLEKKK
jgi:hypothetical protein